MQYIRSSRCGPCHPSRTLAAVAPRSIARISRSPMDFTFLPREGPFESRALNARCPPRRRVAAGISRPGPARQTLVQTELAPPAGAGAGAGDGAGAGAGAGEDTFPWPLSAVGSASLIV